MNVRLKVGHNAIPVKGLKKIKNKNTTKVTQIFGFLVTCDAKDLALQNKKHNWQLLPKVGSLLADVRCVECLPGKMMMDFRIHP